jgi:hypothetical protein
MKFQYTGPDKHKTLELVAFEIMEKDEELKKNQIIEVPDDNKRLVSCLDASGYFKRVEKEESKPVKKPKQKRRTD